MFSFTKRQLRYYNPTTGRFLTQDSYKDSAYEQVAWASSVRSTRPARRTQHLYTYVGNNPVNLVNPTGHFIFTAVGALVGGLTGGIANAINGGGFMSGFTGGLVAGAISGLAVDAIIATGGIAAALIAGLVATGGVSALTATTFTFGAGYVGGYIGNGITQVGSKTYNGESLESGINSIRFNREPC